MSKPSGLGPRRSLESTLFWEAARGVTLPAVRRAIESLERAEPKARAEAQRVLSQLCNDLASLLLEFDPVPIIGLVSYLSRLAVTADPDAYSRFGTEAKIEFLLGVALSGARSPRTPGPAQVQRTIDLVADIFDLEITLLREAPVEGRGHLADARGQLRLEALLDRFQGYLVHLRRIESAVYEPLRSLCESTLGWCPADIYELARSIREVAQSRMDEFHPRMHQRLRSTSGTQPNSELIQAVSEEQAAFAAALFVVTPRQVSEVCDLEAQTVSNALSALSASWEDQPDFRRPSQPNRARRYSVVDLEDDSFFVPMSQALIHEIDSWFVEEARARNLSHLEEAFRRARDSATEEMAKEVLQDVFGSKLVLGPLFYPWDGSVAEVDAVVTLPDDALVVECKAHTLTDAGRRGALDRLKKKFGELVEAPLRQSQRCADYLAAGGTEFRDSAGAHISISVRRGARLPRLAVSFERIDPLATHVPRLAAAESLEAPWLVSLADLLMVTEILTDPASFWSYAVMRQRISNEPRSFVVAEPDVLGLYLDDRCHQMLELLESEPNAAVAIGPSAQELNSFFAKSALGLEADPPESGVPTAVLNAVTEAIHLGNEAWGDLAIAVLEQPADTWRKWSGVERKIRKAMRRGAEAARTVDGRDPPLRLVCCTPEYPPESIHGLSQGTGSQVLVVRMRRKHEVGIANSGLRWTN